MFPASPAKSWKPHWLTLSAIRPSKLTAAAMRWISAASLWKRGRPVASRRPCANSEPEVPVTLTVPLLFDYVRTCSLSSLGNGDDAQETENSIFSFGSLARNKPT